MAYAATFIPRDDLYHLQLEDGRYTKVQRTLYPDLIAAHLKGFITIGAYALDQQNMAKWLCLDADDGLRWYGLLIEKPVQSRTIVGTDYAKLPTELYVFDFISQ